ncbi:hypothetical protein [Streptomyces sp. PU-14G]|uniref:hypothetical protein n=1 Tax=Streptomyces sp. PU-14G TaxID=2800808 RepID=UPI0034DE55DF
MARPDEIPVPQPTEEPRSFSLPGTLAQRWNALAVAACGATVLVMGYRHRWTNDDALIYTRAVRQILAGNGPVFNVAERAETSTGTLWQWLLAAGSAVPGVDDPLRLAVALGLLLTVVGYLLALDGTRRMIRLTRPAGALLPVGVVLLLPLCATWDYATSGLETGLSFAYLGGCWWLLVHARTLRARALRTGAETGTGTQTGAGTGTGSPGRATPSPRATPPVPRRPGAPPARSPSPTAPSASRTYGAARAPRGTTAPG